MTDLGVPISGTYSKSKYQQIALLLQHEHPDLCEEVEEQRDGLMKSSTYAVGAVACFTEACGDIVDTIRCDATGFVASHVGLVRLPCGHQVGKRAFAQMMQLTPFCPHCRGHIEPATEVERKVGSMLRCFNSAELVDEFKSRAPFAHFRAPSDLT